MRYFMTFSYDGTAYSGYQKQPDKMTIQDELEKVLYKLNGDREVSVCSSGRTDAGVHALNQKAHFDMDKEYDVELLKNSINKMLPWDIYIKKIEIVDDNFHARFNVSAKEYIYKINTGEYNPIQKNYVYQFNKRLDVSEMERALKYLEGEHNFKSFTKSTDEIKDYNRKIIQTSLIRDTKNINEITISIMGTGFLRYMVRNIVGLLIEIGQGKYKSEDIFDILKAEDREAAGITAPPNGLYLKDVFY